MFSTVKGFSELTSCRDVDEGVGVPVHLGDLLFATRPLPGHGRGGTLVHQLELVALPLLTLH